VLILSNTSKIEVVTGAASAIDVDVHASHLDDVIATGTVTPNAPTNTHITTAATTDVVTSPTAGSSRSVQTLSVRNRHASVAVPVTVLHTDGTTIVQLLSIPLLPAGYEIHYEDGAGWRVLDPSGNALGAAAPRAGSLADYNAALDFGFVGDLVTVFDGECSSGTATKITSASAAFDVNAKVGQRITLAGAGASGAQYTGTITVIDSATQVGVSPNITTTVSSKGLSFGTDNTAAITAMQNAVNNATFWGARIVFGKSATNAYGFPTPVVFNKPVQIEGIGGGHTADAGDYTRLGGTRGTDVDGGVAYGAFFEVAPAGVMSLKRVAFRHCWLDCRNGDQNDALVGLRLRSCHAFVLEDFFIMDPLAVGLDTNVDADPTEAKDTTRWSIRDFCVRALDNLQAGAVTTPFTCTSAVTLTTTPQSLTVAANSLPAAGYCWSSTPVEAGRRRSPDVWSTPTRP
jgi:hypothetical protein